jgi:iron complex transport system substrate-binding protein
MIRKIQIIILIIVLSGCGNLMREHYSSTDLRIVSLSPEATEILFSLGLADKVVGVTTYCNYPPEAMKKEKVGTFSNPNIEKIVALKPTIVFATGLEQSLLVKRLRDLNLKVYVSFPSNIKELFRVILDIGGLTGKMREAHSLIDGMKQEINKITKQTRSLALNERPKVFVQIWQDPLITIGRQSFLNELIALAGGQNITSDINRAYSYVNLELIVQRNPDCIIRTYMSHTKLEELKSMFGFRKMNAVKSGRVFADIDPDLILRASPRISEGLKELFTRIQGLNIQKNER